METYVLRVWLPDRPGALGAVASRIGAVKGDVVGIEILETGEGQAIDELAVQIPDATLVDLLVNEIRQVDGVHVEEVRATRGLGHDPRLAGLAASAALVEAQDPIMLLAAVDDFVALALNATWVAVIDPSRETNGALIQASGPGVPGAEWLMAFVNGSESAGRLGGASGGPNDVIFSRASTRGVVVVAGRERIPWRERERAHLEAMARIIDARWRALGALQMVDA